MAVFLTAVAATSLLPLARGNKTPCPPGFTPFVTGTATICEDFGVLNGTMVFPDGTILQKRVYAQSATPTWGGFNQTTVSKARDDLLGKVLLQRAATGTDVSYDAVFAALPPIISGWGSKPNFGYAGQHTFTGSRQASVDLVFDHKGDSGQWSGFPRPLTVIPEGIDTTNIFHGLVGGELPILTWVFPVKNGSRAREGLDAGVDTNRQRPLTTAEVVAGCRWEMTVVPVADVEHNHEQPALFRFIRLCGGAISGQPLYFDTNIYTPDYAPPPDDFFEAAVGQRRYWTATWEAEGLATLGLPAGVGTDGPTLRDQAVHSLLRDMITRVDTYFPRYGVCGGAGGCAYGDPHNNGFQEIFTASLAGSLELGAFEYARGVLENYLRFYLKQRGTIAYRGLEMAQSGRMLTLFAQYWRYTGDATTLLKYFDKIQGIVTLLEGRRAAAVAAHPSNDPLHGIPIGHDEADLFVTWAAQNPSGNHTTEMPFYSIAGEYWRGLVDLGQAWVAMGQESHNATVTAAGKSMLQTAPTLLSDLRASMAASHALAAAASPTGATQCWPYVAGRAVCAELETQPSDRDSEPWRTYAELAWSAAAAPTALTDTISWCRDNAQMMRLGMLSGTGSDASGNSLMAFTGLGWAYGLLLADDVETFLLQLFTAAAHANTRGSWTAPEETDIGGGAMPYASSSQLLMPVALRWMLVWEHPLTNNTLWIGRAIPRVWLAEGLNVTLGHIPTSFGRLNITIASQISSRSRILINTSLATSGEHRYQPDLPGGAVLRLRTPGRRVITAVLQAGVPVPPERWSSSDESVSFEGESLWGGAVEVRYAS